MTIAQLVYDNERHWFTDEQIHAKVKLFDCFNFGNNDETAYENLASYG